jgi:hypothetical protein
MDTRRLPLTAIVLVCTSCSWWSRFDDLQESTPVIEMPSPDGMPGFGTTMATVPSNDETVLLVLGEPNVTAKGALYRIHNDAPAATPAASGFCPSKRCLFGDDPAPLHALSLDGKPYASCFILGVGDRNDTLGLLGQCADGKEFVLPVPARSDEHPNVKAPQDVITEDLTALSLGNLLIGDFKYAASAEDNPLIAAATRHLGAAWFYAPGTTTPVVLSPVAPPGQALEDPLLLLGDTFGSEVAVASLSSGGHLVAIASPRGVGNDTQGRVWLYRVVDGKVVHDGPVPDVPAPMGCLPGFRRDFGVHMHTGSLFGTATEQLLISDGSTISIYDADDLAEHPPTSDCSGPPLGSAGYITGVSCVETASVTGCSYVTTGFGRAIALADVDGDGTTELVVGAPSLDVDGTNNAGAALVYRVDPEGKQTRLLEARFLSSRDTGDALGSSVASLRIGSRDVIAAGAPGLGSFFLFYCSTLGGAGRDSSRCE